MSNQNTSTPIQDHVSMPAMFSGPRWASVQDQSPLFRSTLAAAAAFENQVVLNQRQQQHFDALEKASIPSPHAYGRDQGGMQWGRRLTPQEILDEDIELDQKAWLFALKQFLYPDKDFNAEDDLVQAESSAPEHQPQMAEHTASRDILPDSVLSLIKHRRMFNQAFQKICQHWLNNFGRDVSVLHLTSVQKRLLPVIVMMLKDLTSDDITRTVKTANCRKVQGELPQTAIEALLMPFIDQSKSPELRLAQLHELVVLSNIIKKDQASDAFQKVHQYAQRFTSALSSVRREHPGFMALLARLDSHEAKWMKQNPYQVSRVESVILNAAASSPVSPASFEDSVPENTFINRSAFVIQGLTCLTGIFIMVAALWTLYPSFLAGFISPTIMPWLTVTFTSPVLYFMLGGLMLALGGTAMHSLWAAQNGEMRSQKIYWVGQGLMRLSGISVAAFTSESLNTCATWLAQQAYSHQPLPMFVTPNSVSQTEEGAEKVPPGYRGPSKDSASAATHNTPTKDTFNTPTKEQSVKTPTPFPCYPTGD